MSGHDDTKKTLESKDVITSRKKREKERWKQEERDIARKI